MEFAPEPENAQLRAPDRTELPMEQEFVLWEEDRPVSTGGIAK
jgi:hypothetical protein